MGPANVFPDRKILSPAVYFRLFIFEIVRQGAAIVPEPLLSLPVLLLK